MNAMAISNRSVWAMRWVARSVMILWLLFWLFFNVGSGVDELIAEGYSAQGWGEFAMHFLMAMLGVVFLYIAWRYELLAGVLLMAAAVAGFFVFRVGPRIMDPDGMGVFWLFLMPVFVSGLILLVSWLAVRRRGSAGSGN